MKRVQRFAGLSLLLCVAGAAQSLNVTFTEYPIPTANATPEGIVEGPDGALWFTETGAYKIGRITTEGAINEYAVPPLIGGNVVGPQGIAEGPFISGSLPAVWFTLGGGIGSITISGTITEFRNSVSSQPYFIAQGPDGNMWFTDTRSVAVGRVTPSGQFTEYVVPNAPGTPGLGIRGITSSPFPSPSLWFIDYLNRAIGSITTAGVITEYPVPNLATSDAHATITTTGQLGTLWFADGNNSIGTIDTFTGAVTEYPVGVSPSGLVMGPDGNIWFTSETSSQIGRITPSGNVTLYNSPAPGWGIARGLNGTLWYCAVGANEIVRVEVPSRTGVLSHVAAGGGWDTTVTLVNPSSAPVPTRLAFYGDDGTALSLPLTVSNGGDSETVTGAILDQVIGPYATLLVDTGAQLASTVTGWADVTSTAALGGYAIFRQTPRTGAPSEGTVPLQNQFPSAIWLPYDNTNGLVMGMALANLSASPANVTATIWDDSGNQLGTQTITTAANGHTSFLLPNQLSVTAGKRGIVEFQGACPGGIAGLGLRFSPMGTFTSVPILSPTAFSGLCGVAEFFSPADSTQRSSPSGITLLR
jgi:virginiamycin B lyase